MDPASTGPTLYGCYRHPDRGTALRCQRCGRPICGECCIDASVGFHCPECVADAGRRTRGVRGTYGGKPSRNPSLTTLVIIGINLVLWVATFLTGASRSALVPTLALQPVSTCVLGDAAWAGVVPAACLAEGGQWYPGVTEGAWWQIVTSAFMHVEPWHIAFNMLALWVLGPQMERVMGRARFLALYLLSALAGSATVYWLAEPNTSTLGASGAVFGLMGALLVVVWRLGGNPRSILFWLGANVVLTLFVGGISWQGHFGGLAGGLVVTAILVFGPKRAATQWILLGIWAVALLAAIAARTVVLAG